jgi:hypothetical protein
MATFSSRVIRTWLMGTRPPWRVRLEAELEGHLVLARELLDLVLFRGGDVVREDAGDAHAVVVDVQHDVRGLGLAFVEVTHQDQDHEVARGVVVVVEEDLVERRALGLLARQRADAFLASLAAEVPSSGGRCAGASWGRDPAHGGVKGGADGSRIGVVVPIGIAGGQKRRDLGRQLRREGEPEGRVVAESGQQGDDVGDLAGQDAGGDRPQRRLAVLRDEGVVPVDRLRSRGSGRESQDGGLIARQLDVVGRRRRRDRVAAARSASRRRGPGARLVMISKEQGATAHVARRAPGRPRCRRRWRSPP